MKDRFEKVKFLLSEKLTLYPVLIGILFLVNELRKNSAFYTIIENVYLILIVLAFSFVVDYISRKIIRNKYKAAMISVFSIFINLFYLDILLLISSQGVLLNLITKTVHEHRSIVIIPFLFSIWLIFVFTILKIKRVNSAVNLYLNTLIVAFVFVEITKWIFVPVSQIKLAENRPFSVNTSLRPEQKPDIYYIILDSYASSESLRKYWNYDNSRFTDSLKQLGFFIAQKSKSDFDFTPYCLASYLNSSSLVLDSYKHNSESDLFYLIRKNRLFKWLNDNKYLCYNYSPFDAFGSKRYYHFYGYNHFLARTIWYTISSKLYDYYNHYMEVGSKISQTSLSVFKEINFHTLKTHDRPSFLYAHVMMPHWPFLFNENGNPYSKTDSLTDKQKYLGQLIYTNSLTLESISNILKFSHIMPIIIIQSDHGFRGLEDTTPIEISNEGHSIFYAIYSPKGLIVSDTINPKNTFKILTEFINH